LAEQAPSGPQGQTALSRTTDMHPTQHGRPTSWVATCIIVVGFTVGGIALCIGPSWWLFWTGTGIVVLGAIYGASTHMMDDWY
jgi:4-hydroxybenzoate polyprenyltransferase